MAAPPILSLALPSETGRVLSIQSHTVQVLDLPLIGFPESQSKSGISSFTVPCWEERKKMINE